MIMIIIIIMRRITMKHLMKHMLVTMVLFGLADLAVHTKTQAEELPEHSYVDFSSDRSTWFFRTDGGDRSMAFFDFFSPFDPTVKVEGYDPLTSYELEHRYYFGEDDALMVHIEDMKKMYDPYFDYTMEEDTLRIRHTAFDKLLTSGIGERSTTIQYTKKVWDLSIDLSEVEGTYDYREFQPVEGGRNKGAVTPDELNEEAGFTGKSFTLSSGSIEQKEGGVYVPLASLMEWMGKTSFEEQGYLTVQSEGLADVTTSVDRPDVEVSDIVVPKPSNIWQGGEDETYTWADYMKDVEDGERQTGWLWQSFHVASDASFKDEDGDPVHVKADRIVPFSLYVPSTYDPEKTRLTFMLHGGTGNEHTPTYRLMKEGIPVETYAEEYNYILLSPNGWTQNPIWREKQALYSVERSLAEALQQFPVPDDHLFITGNSLGGRGTLEIAARFPDRFQAMAATAPKITDRAPEGGTMVNIEGTDYDLSAVKDLPALIVQGTADTTTSFKVQIGSGESPGSIVSSVMPKLENARYMTVENGDHSYSYAAVLEPIFDFFEDQLTEENAEAADTAVLYKESARAAANGEQVKLDQNTEVVNGTMMVALSSVKELYKASADVYPIHLYDSDSEQPADYWTLVVNNQTMNITPGEEAYRLNMERYKEDAKVTRSGAPSDEDQLDASPVFTEAPYEKNGELYVPAEEVLTALGLDVTIREENVWQKYRAFWGSGAAVIVFALIGGWVIFRKRSASKSESNQRKQA
ncbi:alpha/beta fold hydrolase [Halobacillus halophilus]|nr:alpha/beta fold hydrolase [Halobacillus halophilus]